MASESVGTRIQKAIGYRARSQRSVALAIGTSVNGLNRIIKGHTADPASSLITALALELDVSADYLLGITDVIETVVER